MPQVNQIMQREQKKKHFHKLLQFTNLLNAYNNIAMASPGITNSNVNVYIAVCRQIYISGHPLIIIRQSQTRHFTLTMYIFGCRCLFSISLEKKNRIRTLSEQTDSQQINIVRILYVIRIIPSNIVVDDRKNYFRTFK